jgi:predicted transposase YbfD/YdcC
MGCAPAGSLVEHFGDLDDPRHYNRRHLLVDIVVVAICAVVCGADDWGAVEEFGQARYKWLKGFLALPHGIPSDDTFRRVFARLDAQQFQGRFITWVQDVFEITEGQVVPIDGKTLRRSYDRGLDKDAIHMVSAWATENEVVLGQIKMDDKSNEITAIPALLELLDVSGCIVTIDAIGCQKKIAQQIIDQGADYILALKSNQERVYQDAKTLFEDAEAIGYQDCDRCKTVNKDHGRIEIRECWTTAHPEYLQALYKPEQWAGLQSVIKVYAERRFKGKVETETRYFLSSRPGDNAQNLLNAVRAHWQIENRLHWVLDVTFREDDCRLRKGNGDQNFAVLRHIALTLLRQERTLKRGVKSKRLRAGWDPVYLLKVLTG